MKLQERKRKKISNAHFEQTKAKKSMKRCRIDLHNLEEYMFYMTREEMEY